MNINEEYLINDVPQQMGAHFDDAGIILLHDFLEKDTLALIEQSVGKKIWDRKNKPGRFSYEVGNSSKFDEIFGEEFLSFASEIVGKDVKVFDVSVKKFSHRDYTLLHDSDSFQDKGVKFCYFIVDSTKGIWDKEFGGQKVFTNEKSENPQIIIPEHNALCFANLKDGIMDFVKYVNCNSGKNHFIIIEGYLR